MLTMCQEWVQLSEMRVGGCAYLSVCEAWGTCERDAFVDKSGTAILGRRGVGDCDTDLGVRQRNSRPTTTAAAVTASKP